MAFLKPRGLALLCLVVAGCGQMMAAGAAMPPPAVDDVLAAKPGQAIAVVAGGCFWGIQACFSTHAACCERPQAMPAAPPTRRTTTSSVPRRRPYRIRP